ncbi:kunitz-type serine protease inhibitor bitisilin-1 [Toxorhynchites rutilus septentrionalis]|uniref:kunitz-type serine protease inhibitor bitisilin-1 n=1 Tax=Toxorhynchites rutilus septentrionalis TaxID=329112 RepID=UPI0024791920|nr:kunitz-type serine protease inhibitor bitisilin-1 [Toxorhynchites rutilus septentrionalis]
MQFSNSARWIALGVAVSFLMTIRISDARPRDVWDQLTSEGGKMFYKMLEYLSDYDEFDDENAYNKREGSAALLAPSNRVDTGIKGEKCKLPQRKGVCRALLPRWRYDPDSKTCHEFTFGGCDGNANNFMSYEKCMETCKGV